MRLLHKVREFDHFPNKWELTKLLHDTFELDIMKGEERWKILKTHRGWEVCPNERLNRTTEFVFDNYFMALLLKILLEKELLNKHGRDYPYGRNEIQKTHASLRSKTPRQDQVSGTDKCEAGWCEGDGTEWSSAESFTKTDPE